MPGIGKYKKGAKFMLKSGNTPPFKYMGSSPMKQDEIDPIPDPEEGGDVVIKEKTEEEKEKTRKKAQEMYDRAMREVEEKGYQGPPIDEL